MTFLTDMEAQRTVERWRVRLGIARPVRRERTSIWQVTDERGRSGCSLIGVLWDEWEACIVHTRRLTEEDIVHELLHVAYPEWSEAQVIAKTQQIITARATRRAANDYRQKRKGNDMAAYSVTSEKTGSTYYLHGRRKTAKGGGTHTLYFFRKEPTDEALDALPAGYEVAESPATGLPLLKRAAVRKSS